MDELAKRFGELAEKYGPNVVDASLRAVAVGAYSTLMAGGLAILIGAVGIIIGIKLWKKVLNDRWDEIAFMPAGIMIGLGVLACLAGLWCFIDPWTWAAINHPELWIARKVLKI